MARKGQSGNDTVLKAAKALVNIDDLFDNLLTAAQGEVPKTSLESRTTHPWEPESQSFGITYDAPHGCDISLDPVVGPNTAHFR
jgi:hypothetical protein